MASVGVLVFSGDEGPMLVDRTPDTVPIGSPAGSVTIGLDTALCERRGFTGKVGRSLVALGAGGAPAIVFVGCGDARKANLETLRRASAAFVRAAGRTGTGLLVVPAGVTGESGEEADGRAGQAVAEGAILAGYRFVGHKSENDESQDRPARGDGSRARRRHRPARGRTGSPDLPTPSGWRGTW